MSANPSSKKSMGTELYAPAMALQFITNELGISDTQIEKQHGISRRTLTRIRAGSAVPRAYEYYMGVFISMLNQKRLTAVKLNDTERSDQISNLLRDLLLVHYGLPTDQETTRNERIKKYGAP